MRGYFYLNRMKHLLFTQRTPPASAMKVWPEQFDDEVTTTGAVWALAIESVALGAKPVDVMALLYRWQLTADSAVGFAKRCGIRLEQTKVRAGSRNEPEWMATFYKLPPGVPPQIKYGMGGSPLEALASLTQAGAYLANQDELKKAVPV